MLPQKRLEAKKLQVKRYFTGKPCKNGHIAERNTITGKCTECKHPCSANWRIYNARWKAKYQGREQEVKYRYRYGVELSEIRPKPLVCDICGQEHKKIVFDHCHQSGQFRGWLCDPCNIVLGNVKDDPAILRRMISYLEGENTQEFRTASNGMETGSIGQPSRSPN